MPKNTSVTIGEHFDRFIAGQVESGRFHSTSEVIRAGLRLLEDEELKLQNLRVALEAAEGTSVVNDFDINGFIASKSAQK